MAQKNKALIVLGSLVVIGSVGYYLFTKSKKSKGAGSLEPTPNDTPTPTPTPKDTPIVGKGTTLPPKYEVPTWLNTTEKIKTFQNWLDDNYPKWLKGKKLNRGSGWGNLGENTKSAWDSYGTQFINSRKLAMAKGQFKRGQFVIAKNTFTASAVIVRNGKYMKSDGSGTPLPTRTYKANADLGVVKDILANGNIVLTVPPAIGTTYGTRVYTDILVSPTDIQ